MESLKSFFVGARAPTAMLQSRFRPVLVQKLSVSTAARQASRDLHNRWSTRWKQRGGKGFTNAVFDQPYGSSLHPLTPLYYRHLGASILDALKAFAEHSTSTKSARNICIGSIYDNDLINPKVGFDLHMANSSLVHLGRDLESYIEKFGEDTVRLYVVLRGRQEGRNDKEFHTKWLIEMEQLLEKTRAAIEVAHSSYDRTQSYESYDYPGPDEINKPDMGCWLDYLVDSERSYVHVPPQEFSLDVEHERVHSSLWMTAQNAIRAMTLPLGLKDTKDAEVALSELVQDIIDFKDGDYLLRPEVHFDAARTLLCLLAPIVPAFAEDAWRVLLEGPSASEYLPGGIISKKTNSLQSTDALHDDSLLDLPRKGFPHTLYSVFDQPFPLRLSEEEMKQLLREVYSTQE